MDTDGALRRVGGRRYFLARVPERLRRMACCAGRNTALVTSVGWRAAPRGAPKEIMVYFRGGIYLQPNGRAATLEQTE